MKTCRRVFIKQLGVGVGAGLVCGLPATLEARQGKSLRRSVPEEQGVNSAGILEFLNALETSKYEFHSIMILRHGCVIAEGWWQPYQSESPQMLYSLSKSFTSTAVGLAVEEGRLSVDDKVLKFFPEDAPDKVSDNLAALRVRDLLSMSVGHAEDSTGTLWGKENWVRQFLSLPIKNPPGTAFLYNSGATYMCSAIVQKLTGQRVLDYLKPRLFEPLGIRTMSWETCPRGINTGGWGLKLPTEALAKFGQLYLQKGVWNGRQLVSSAWVQEATSFKIQQPAADLEKAKRESDWNQGYCYQFWRSRHNSFRGDGAFGQYVLVLPEEDAVVAITSESPNMQGELNLVWDHLLPALRGGSTPEKGKQTRELEHRLSTQLLPPLKGQGSPPLASRITGHTYQIESNEHGLGTFSWKFSTRKLSFTISDTKGTHVINCGIENWRDGESTVPGMPPKLTRGDLGPVAKVAACASWLSPETLEMRWQFTETPHHATVTCQFGDSGNSVEVTLLDSLAKMGSGQPRWKLKATSVNGKA